MPERDDRRELRCRRSARARRRAAARAHALARTGGRARRRRPHAHARAAATVRLAVDARLPRLRDGPAVGGRLVRRAVPRRGLRGGRHSRGPVRRELLAAQHVEHAVDGMGRS